MESYHYLTNKCGIEYFLKGWSVSQAESRTDLIEPTEGSKSTYAITVHSSIFLASYPIYHLTEEKWKSFKENSFFTEAQCTCFLSLDWKGKRIGHQLPSYQGKVNLNHCTNSSYFQVIEESRISKPLILTRGKTTLDRERISFTSKKVCVHFTSSQSRAWSKGPNYRCGFSITL